MASLLSKDKNTQSPMFVNITVIYLPYS
jgi:hypothetical protein